MDRQKFSFIAHRDHDYCNPIGAAKIERMLDLLKLSPGDRVVDYGSGKAELAIRVIERFGSTVDAVEISVSMSAAARLRANRRAPYDKLYLRECDARTFGEPESFAMAICFGATHAFGSFEKTLAALKRVTRPKGQVLIADGYWKREPCAEYLAALGAKEDEMTTHAGNVALGLVPLHATMSSDDEWDEYEWKYSRSIETYAIENPTDPDVPAMLEKIRSWRRTYLNWGRDTLGFGMYLFHRP